MLKEKEIIKTGVNAINKFEKATKWHFLDYNASALKFTQETKNELIILIIDFTFNCVDVLNKEYQSIFNNYHLTFEELHQINELVRVFLTIEKQR